ncbi:hypothetical protein LDL77_19225 [Flagellimonas marinaquae]|uniref:hypothetical protein n=1 Tax=Flagellimonas aurea TaxID=2915619 RepID=UPI001CE0E7F7|nr:hypothetical protein LDL77_19225 [Allomuricauda aquimarina]
MQRIEIVYKSDFNLILVLFRLFFTIITFIVIYKIIEGSFNIILIIFALFGLKGFFGLLWMVFGNYKLVIDGNSIEIRKKIFYTFFSKKIEFQDIVDLKLIFNYKTDYTWGSENFYLRHEYENAISIVNKEKELVLYIPDKSIYTQIKDRIVSVEKNSKLKK